MKLKRKILKISGEDRVKFLNDLITVPVEADMTLAYGALLSPQGKIMSDLFISSEGDALLLDLPESQYDAVKSKLGLYKLRAKVEFADDPRAVLQLPDGYDPRGEVGGRHYGEANALWDDGEYTKARIRAVVPEFDADFGADHAYPREWRFDEMKGVDYRKGCFVGQEIVARMRHKSELLKSVFRVFAEDDLQIGTIIYSGDKEIGEVLSTSANEALAFLRIKNTDFDNLTAGRVELTLDETR